MITFAVLAVWVHLVSGGAIRFGNRGSQCRTDADCPDRGGFICASARTLLQPDRKRCVLRVNATCVHGNESTPTGIACPCTEEDRTTCGVGFSFESNCVNFRCDCLQWPGCGCGPKTADRPARCVVGGTDCEFVELEDGKQYERCVVTAAGHLSLTSLALLWATVLLCCS